jgi:hypothetical protein
VLQFFVIMVSTKKSTFNIKNNLVFLLLAKCTKLIHSAIPSIHPKDTIVFNHLDKHKKNVLGVHYNIAYNGKFPSKITKLYHLNYMIKPECYSIYSCI